MPWWIGSIADELIRATLFDLHRVHAGRATAEFASQLLSCSRRSAVRPRQLPKRSLFCDVTA